MIRNLPAMQCRAALIPHGWDTCPDTLASLICPGERVRVVLAGKLDIF